MLNKNNKFGRDGGIKFISRLISPLPQESRSYFPGIFRL